MQINIKMTPSIQGLIVRLGKDIEAGIDAGIQNLLSDIEAEAVPRTPVRTSNLVDSITNYVIKGSRQGVIKATSPYAAFVHFGTGLFGPKKKRIVPIEKKALFWVGAKHPVKSTKGMKPQPFLYAAAEKIKPQISFEEGIMNYLRMRGW